jgi:hypothetical protein
VGSGNLKSLKRKIIPKENVHLIKTQKYLCMYFIGAKKKKEREREKMIAKDETSMKRPRKSIT